MEKRYERKNEGIEEARARYTWINGVYNGLTILNRLSRAWKRKERAWRGPSRPVQVVPICFHIVVSPLTRWLASGAGTSRAEPRRFLWHRKENADPMRVAQWKSLELNEEHPRDWLATRIVNCHDRKSRPSLGLNRASQLSRGN